MTITLTLSLNWLRRLLVAVGLWVARRGGWTPIPPPPCSLPPADQVALAVDICRDVAARFADASGEARRREAQRVLMNCLPGLAARDRNLLLELGLQCAG